MSNIITKKIDSMGRLTIPKTLRQLCGIDYGAEVEVFLIDDETIGVKLYNESTLKDNEVQYDYTLKVQSLKCREEEKIF